MNPPAAALGPVSWERMSEGIEKVKDRLKFAATALEATGTPYAVILIFAYERVIFDSPEPSPGVDKIDLSPGDLAFASPGVLG